ncbi:MAG: Tol-Pal system beta propeller repeat protein TolB [Gammaproteobacteria bacterium]
MTMFKNVLRILVPVIAGSLLLVGNARAVLQIEITQGVEGGIPIAIVPFQWTGSGPAPAEDVSAVISADLRSTGQFKLLPEKDFLEHPHRGDEVNFDNWRALGVNNLVVGQVQPAAKGNYKVQFQLFDIYKTATSQDVGKPDYKIKQMAGYSLPSTASHLRHTAHVISDIIYQQLIGKRGAFTTHIAYITAIHKPNGTTYALEVADADGHNPHEVLTSSHPIMSPAWSPDGKRLAYVSFETGRPAIYIQDLATGKRQLISARKGINGAPAWSPDGKKLALTLSFEDEGNPEVFVMDLATRKLRRITYNSAIDTEAAWAPDGKSIIFTSDRSGGPQLYRVSANGGRPQRLTFDGSYNAGAAISPDGTMLAMVHGTDQGLFRIAVMDLKTGLFRVLTDGREDESPTFAPNGSMILYATDYKKNGVLAAVSVDGRVRQRLEFHGGDVREPAWGPFSDQ